MCTVSRLQRVCKSSPANACLLLRWPRKALLLRNPHHLHDFSSSINNLL